MKVLVVGAGIGGATLAIALASAPQPIEVHLFERDADVDSRKQGLVIGLQQGGIDILTNKLQAFEISQHFSIKNGAKDLSVIIDGQVVLKGRDWLTVTINGVQYSAMVDRALLRQALLFKLTTTPGVRVHYGKQFERYTEDASGVTAHFTDGSSFEGDVLVGADGHRSKVRDQRCKDLTPQPLGYWTNAGTVVNHDDLTGLVVSEARHSLVRMSGKKGASLLCFACQSVEQSKLLWSVSMPQAVADEYSLSSDMDVAVMKRTTIQLAHDLLGTEAAQLITRTTESEFFKGYDITSVDAKVVKQNPLGKAAQSRVTLLGDAAHKTTTQAGLGATAAIQDAYVLSQHLTQAATSGQLVAALRQYEKAMSAAAYAVVQRSVSNTMSIHETNARKIAHAKLFLHVFNSIITWWERVRKWFGRKRGAVAAA